MNDTRVLKDTMHHHDTISHQNKPFVRTKIIGGYDAYVDKHGVTRFGETVFETENMVELGGSIFTLEKLFGVKAKLNVQFLEDIIPDVKLPDEKPITEFYPKDTVVCLFGVGTGGAGESMTDVVPVRYHEREIKDMIPIRQTANELTADEAEKYWFRKTVTVDGAPKTAYYLKRFENDPEIKVLWRDAEGDDDGSEVQDNVHETPESNTTPIETFVELVLKVNKKDVREYFQDSGNVEQTRINSIGLFTGIKHKVQDIPELYDYRQVKLFSKLNINNEMLTLAKDLTIVYRIYTS